MENKVLVDREKVDMYIMSNKKYFPAEKIMYVKQRLYQTEERKFEMISCMEFKDPTVILIISILLGSFGIDRFMLGDTGMGVLKLLTLGVGGILTIIDWFIVQNKAKEKNFEQLMSVL